MNKDWQLQYSNSDGNGGILVARADDMETMETLKNWVDGVMGKRASKVASTPVVAPPTPIVEEMCAVHNIPLKQRISKAGKPYKSHVRKVGEDWDRCFGKGYMSELEGQSSTEIGASL